MHHGVDITDPAIVAAATLSHRYITDRFLPDKAIDLIDEAAARIKIEIDSKPELLDKLERRLIQLKIEREALKRETDDASVERLSLLEEEMDGLEKELADLDEEWRREKAQAQGSANIKEKIDALRGEMVELQRQGLFDKVAEIQYGQLPELERQLKETESAEQSEQTKPRLLKTQVGVDVKSLRSSVVRQAFLCQKCCKASVKNCWRWRTICMSVWWGKTSLYNVSPT